MATKHTKVDQTVNPSLSGKVACITGASRGIGAAVAKRLAAHGVKVAAGARTTSDLGALKADIEKMQGVCLDYTLDVRDQDSVAEFLSVAQSQLGAVDILINNAGIYATEPVAGHDLALWHDVIATNLTSALFTCRLVVPSMTERRCGRIINISSISGKVAEAYGAAYSASKFGLIGLSQSLALEVAHLGITVNAVCPGWVETKMASDQLSCERYLDLTEQEPSEAKDIARLSVPQRRFIEPAEVAGLVVYLCSDEARGITGQAINICGGLSLH
jgi:NAD(P)-dependent dehydrogenase (short-subunit alcohol dehydrogenase family)